MAPEGQKPSKWLCLTKLPREMYSQPIVHKALSWGAIRKSACILAEITIRKSQEPFTSLVLTIIYGCFDIRQTCRFQGRSFLKFLFSGETDLDNFESRKRKQ